jgi:hypothetical protein
MLITVTAQYYWLVWIFAHLAWQSYFKCADLRISPLKWHTLYLWWLTNRSI